MLRFALALSLLFLVTPAWAADAGTDLIESVELTETAELVEAAELVDAEAPLEAAEATPESDVELPSWLDNKPVTDGFSTKVDQSIPRGCPILWCQDFCGGYCIIFSGRCECA